MKKLTTLLFMTVFMLSFAVSVSAASKVYVNTDANLRRGPGMKYKISDVADDGDVLEYLGDIQEDTRGVDWYKVSYNGEKVWISSRCATLQRAKPISSAKRRVITKADCNLRKGPGLGYKVYVDVQKGSSFKYLGSSKRDDRGVKWYKISYYGKSLWVSSKVSYRKNSSSYRNVYVKLEQVFLRKGPGMDYDDVYTVYEGTVMRYLNKSSRDDRGIKWYKVSYKGKKLWISSKTCSIE